MYVEVQDGKVSYNIPQIEKNAEGKPKALGMCYAKEECLDCYGWENEDCLVIYSKIEADPNDIPVHQYYCYNLNKQELGWVTYDQVKFELSSYFGEPYHLQEV